MADFASIVANAQPLTKAEQKEAGTPMGGDMGDAHKNFCATLVKLIDSKEIDVQKPDSFLNHGVYDKLSDEWKAKADFALVNMATLLNHIDGFFRSKQTPDACPQLATMIEQLWDMKSRLETDSHVNIFKF